MQTPPMPAVVLASSSAYRRRLLERILDQFETLVPATDESRIAAEAPPDMARRLARSKAEAVARQRPDALVIGSDQLAVLDQQILGKPGEHHKAVQQLMESAGKTVTFLTAVCVLDPFSRQRHEHTDRTEVRFRRFDRRLAEQYLHREPAYDCAGSFKVEGAGVVLFESIHSTDPTALIGLPLIWLSGILREAGVRIP